MSATDETEAGLGGAARGSAASRKSATAGSAAIAAVGVAGRSLVPDRYRGFFQQAMVLATLVVLFVLFASVNPAFLNWPTISSMLLAAVVTGVQALGLCFVIATGGIDLTPGLGMSVTAVVGAQLMVAFHLPMAIGILGCVLCGALIGTVNGFLVAKVKMQPMIATLAMMMVCWGMSLVLSNGTNIYLREIEGYGKIATGHLIPGLPNAVLIFAVLAVVAGVLMGKTSVGRYALAIGSNKEAARISGIKTVRWEIAMYAICGVFTGISGVIMSSRLNQAQGLIGQGYEMYAIAAAVIGGTSLRGGRASIFGAVIGAITIQTIFTGLTFIGVADQWQKVVLGGVVLVAVFIDIMRRGGKEE
ncbi:MAG: ABC transporter permease [Propionibacteriaceae bacterium]|jgi:ribose transport system permease protein|nr:ABC transporter permease [Propionibacteriaceae bacterium]